MSVSITSQNPLTYTVTEGGNDQYALVTVGTIDFTYDNATGVSFTQFVTDTASDSSEQNPDQGLFASNIQTYANGSGTVGFSLAVPDSTLFQSPDGITITFDLKLIESTQTQYNISSDDQIITVNILPFGSAGFIKLSASQTLVISDPVQSGTIVEFPSLGTAALDIQTSPGNFQGTINGLQPGDEIDFGGPDIIVDAVPVPGGIDYLFKNGDVQNVPVNNNNPPWAVGVARDLNGGTKTVIFGPGNLKATVTNTGAAMSTLSQTQIDQFDAAVIQAFGQYAQKIAGSGNISIALNFITDTSANAPIAQFSGPGIPATDSNGNPILDPKFNNQQVFETVPQYVIAHNGAQPTSLANGAADVTINVNLADLSQIDLNSTGTNPDQETVYNLFLHELGHAFGINYVSTEETIFASYLAFDNNNQRVFVDPTGSIAPIPVVISQEGAHLVTGKLDIMTADTDQLLGKPNQTLSPFDLAIFKLIDPPVYGEIDISPGTTFELSSPAFAGENIGFINSLGTSTALKLDVPVTGSINSFVAGDTIDLTYVTTTNFGGGANNVNLVWTENSDGSGGTLSVFDPSQGSSPVATLSLAGSYSTNEFVVSNDGSSHPLISLAGYQTFYAGDANLSFTGVGVHNSVVFEGASTQYQIVNNGNGSVTTTDSIADRDGTDQITGVEFLQFTDQIIFVENADNANIARLYSAAFNRAPDISGLSFWEDVYANGVPASAKAAGYYTALAQTDDGSGTSIAANFMQSSEFTSTYGSLSDAAFVTLLYQNVLGRAPDQAGLNFWVGQLEGANPASRATVLVGFAESPENVAKTSIWLVTT